MTGPQTITIRTTDGNAHHVTVHDGSAQIHAVTIETCGYACRPAGRGAVHWYSAGDIVSATVRPAGRTDMRPDAVGRRQ